MPDVAFDTKFEAGATEANGAFSFLSSSGDVAGSVGNNANRVLIVGISISVGATAPAVTWAGTTMDLIGQGGSQSSLMDLWFFGLKDPAVGAQTLAATWTGGLRDVALGAVSLYNCNTAGTAWQNFGNTDTGTSTAPSGTTTSAAGNMAVAMRIDDNASGTPSVPTGTLDWNEGDLNGNAGMAHRASTSASTVITWTIGSSVLWVVMKVDVVRAPDSGTTVGLTGSGGTGARGSVAADFSTAVTGKVGTGAAGTEAPGISVPLVGQVGTGAIGSLGSPEASVALDGATSAGELGSLAVGDATIGLTGVGVTGAVGTSNGYRGTVIGFTRSGFVAPAFGNTAALAGAPATGAVGQVVASGSEVQALLTGRSAIGTAGSVVAQLALTGVNATSARGSIAGVAFGNPLHGTALTGAVGSLTAAVGAGPALTGVSAADPPGARNVVFTWAPDPTPGVTNYHVEVENGTGLMAEWRLDEASGLVAGDVVGLRPATIGAAVTLGAVSPRPGRTAATFTGVSASNVLTPSIQPPLAHTLVLWVKTLGVSMTALYTNFFGVPGRRIIGINASGQVTVRSLDDATTITALGAINDGLWHHIVWSTDGAGGGNSAVSRLSVDGVLKTTLAQRSFSAPGQIRLGGSDNGVDDWVGGLAGIEVFSMQLIDAEITALFSLTDAYDLNVGSTATTLTALIANGTYFWRVRSYLGAALGAASAPDIPMIVGGRLGLLGLTLSKGITGVQALALAGPVAAQSDAAASLGGVAVAGSVGTLTAEASQPVTLSVTGVTATGARGLVGSSRADLLTGQELVHGTNVVVVNLARSVVGVTAPTQVGVVGSSTGASTTVSVTGVQAAGIAGLVTPNTVDVSVGLTGVSAIGAISIGGVIVNADATALASGVVAVGQRGSVIPTTGPITAAVSGAGMLSAVGLLGVSITSTATVALTGVASTGQRGALSSAAARLLAGQEIALLEGALIGGLSLIGFDLDALLGVAHVESMVTLSGVRGNASVRAVSSSSPQVKEVFCSHDQWSAIILFDDDELIAHELVEI